MGQHHAAIANDAPIYPSMVFIGLFILASVSLAPKRTRTIERTAIASSQKFRTHEKVWAAEREREDRRGRLVVASTARSSSHLLRFVPHPHAYGHARTYARPPPPLLSHSTQYCRQAPPINDVVVAQVCLAAYEVLNIDKKNN